MQDRIARIYKFGEGLNSMALFDILHQYDVSPEMLQIWLEESGKVTSTLLHRIARVIPCQGSSSQSDDQDDRLGILKRCDLFEKRFWHWVDAADREMLTNFHFFLSGMKSSFSHSIKLRLLDGGVDHEAYVHTCFYEVDINMDAIEDDTLRNPADFKAWFDNLVISNMEQLNGE